VTEAVGVNVPHPGLGGAALQDLANPGVGHPTLLAHPQRRQGGLRVLGAGPQVAAQRVGGLRAVRDGAAPATLAHHERHRLLGVQVADVQPGQLPGPHPSVDQHAEDRGVPPVLERVALGGIEERP
jgi:hypothetical protein